MKLHKAILGLLILSTASMSAQEFIVSAPRHITVPAGHACYHPQFNPQGNELLVTSEAFDGLALVSIADGQYRTLSQLPGAGYKATISPDGSMVVMREAHLADQSMSIHTLDLATMQRSTIVSHGPHVNNIDLSRGQLTIPLNSRLTTRAVSSTRMKAAPRLTTPATLVTEEDLKMVVYRNGVRHVVDPILASDGRDVNYCWTSLSPDGTRLLFVAHNTAYTSDLDGNDLIELGPLHAPVWRDNDWVVGMIDSDDGHVITKSDIHIVAARDSSRRQLLTPRDGIVKMFPAVSPDGQKVAYNTIDGDLYIFNITPLSQ